MIVRILLVCCGLLATTTFRQVEASNANLTLTKVNYITSVPLKLDMNNASNVKIELVFNKDLIIKQKADNFVVTFSSKTLSPQFSIMELDKNNSRISVSRRQLEGSRFIHSASLKLLPTYIGHAVVSPDTLEYTNANREVIKDSIEDDPSMQLKVTVVKSSEGSIWETIFIVSVTILITISYVNLGAQLDIENLKAIVKKPGALILGFFITVLVMPVVSWLVGLWLLRDQLLYRVGSFIFACCPTATASTLWTVMFNSDKELSIGLQAISTLGSLFTMPLLLFFMDKALQLEGDSKQTIQVPYSRLIGGQFGLVIALLIGWYFIGRKESAKKISAKVFKPLTFFILFFIIVFSTVVYWYIYAMFDWQITLSSLVITLVTYCISSLLGFLASFNIDHAVAISISSTYKNSGIAFAVLLVAFESPDTYINFVPCLTQVLTTSIILYLIYLVYILVNYIRRRDQPDPITATPPVAADDGETEVKRERTSRSGSGSSEKSTREVENDEFIAMNVTDVVAGSPGDLQAASQQKDHTAQ